ncbi:MAG: phosphatase PAP2 family protein [Rickettsiales bacterium]|nr:phosphatase PAP2 family protein [Rickettsiales bacterium]
MNLVCKSFFVASVCCVANNSHAYTIERAGDMLNLAIPAYAFGEAVQESTQKSDYTSTKQFAYSYITALLTQVAIKELKIEQRPNGGDLRSFPSGHTQSAFSGAAFIRKRYGFKQAIVPYLLAGFVGYSRVYAKAHYWHDVVAGAMVAELWAWLLVDRCDSGINILVSADKNGVSLYFNLKF